VDIEQLKAVQGEVVAAVAAAAAVAVVVVVDVLMAVVAGRSWQQLGAWMGECNEPLEAVKSEDDQPLIDSSSVKAYENSRQEMRKENVSYAVIHTRCSGAEWID
jgi:phage tail tape-measure protein